MYEKPAFFLGANSDRDFVSYFKQLQEQTSSMQLFILKGGPGSGKSTLMKKVLGFAEAKGHKLEVIPCASDPLSLDAFIDYTSGFSMIDGTSPHTEDPSIPGAKHHILYTGDLWDCKKLRESTSSIERLTKEVSDYHKSAGAYIKSAAALLGENKRYSKQFFLEEKALSFCRNFVKELKGGTKSKITKRLLSAVSVGEIKFFQDTASYYADKIFVIHDRWGFASDFIMQTVSFYAKLKGESFIYCPCSIMPDKCDHLIFPDSRVALITKNRFLRPENNAVEEIFYSAIPLEKEMEVKESMASDLLEKSCLMVKKAKLVHDDLEAFYREAMDFSRTEVLFESIISRFYS